MKNKPKISDSQEMHSDQLQLVQWIAIVIAIETYNFTRSSVVTTSGVRNRTKLECIHRYLSCVPPCCALVHGIQPAASTIAIN